MKHLLLVCSLLLVLNSACKKTPPAAVSDDGARETELCTEDMLAAEVKPGNYWYARVRTEQAKAMFMKQRVELYKRFGEDNQNLKSLLEALEVERQRHFTEIMTANKIASLSDLEPTEACREVAGKAREKYIQSHPALREELNQATADLKGLEEELAALAPDDAAVVEEEGEEVRAQPASYHPPSEEEEEEEADSDEDEQTANVAAGEYWDRRIMFMRNVKEYLERRRDIAKENGVNSREGQEALQDLRADFKDEILREAMSEDYVPDGCPLVEERAREAYLRANPGLRAEFNQITSEMMDLRDEIIQADAEQEEKNTSHPLP